MWLVLHKGFFPEVSQDHETIPQVLFSRNLRLDVALTFLVPGYTGNIAEDVDA
jgi:hypothetical protein